MAIIISLINAHLNIEILDKFLIPTIENWFGDDEIIFQDNNASCHRTKVIKESYEIDDMASEQSGCKSNWKFMMSIFKK